MAAQMMNKVANSNDIKHIMSEDRERMNLTENFANKTICLKNPNKGETAEVIPVCTCGDQKSQHDTSLGVMNEIMIPAPVVLNARLERVISASATET